jgi:type III restriction enzyme
MERLRQWCIDVNKVQHIVHYDYVFVDEAGFKKYQPTTFDSLVTNFTLYKN